MIIQAKSIENLFQFLERKLEYSLCNLAQKQKLNTTLYKSEKILFYINKNTMNCVEDKNIF